MAKDQEPTRTQVANKVVEVAEAVAEIPARRIDDIPKDFARADGAREIAVLTLTALSHDFEFKPVMDALEKLAALDDWSHSFFVAHTGRNQRPTFDWREAPQRKYESFKDFYAQELEQTFGSWENLQHTWAEVAKGKITEDEARKLILRGHGGDRKSEAVKDQGSNTTLIGRGAEYIAARLERDGLDDLATKVRSGEMSAHAAAIEAGFRKKLTPFEQIDRLIAKHRENLTDEEREKLREKLGLKNRIRHGDTVEPPKQS